VGGDSGVGKTSLLRRYVDGMFDESTIMTVGVDFFFKQIEIDNLGTASLQLWDLGGQERFRHLMENYVMGAKAAILLIDLTRPPNINGILEWVNIVRMHDLNLPIVLVGTKYDFKEVDDSLILTDEEDALNIKNAFNMIDYVITSSKLALNIEKVFEILVNTLTKKNQN
jgi:small GTP-binding protein